MNIKNQSLSEVGHTQCEEQSLVRCVHENLQNVHFSDSYKKKKKAAANRIATHSCLNTVTLLTSNHENHSQFGSHTTVTFWTRA